jgi:hypothetical protein
MIHIKTLIAVGDKSCPGFIWLTWRHVEYRE